MELNNDEVYVRKGDDELVEIIIQPRMATLVPRPYIRYKKGERYGFLGLKRTKENLYSDVFDCNNILYTRQEFIDTFKIDPENDKRPKTKYYIKLVRKSGRFRQIQFNSVDEARNWVKSQYPEYSERVE